VKEFLSRKGVPYVERDVSIDRAAAQEMVAQSGQRGVPVTTIDGQIVVGFDRARLEQILQTRQPSQSGHASLGISVADARSMMVGGRPIANEGAYVGRVTGGSAGERLGLKPGDMIVELNGRPILIADDVGSMIAVLSSGARVRVSFVRGGQRLTAETTL
jgi:S1-C subfamily serine protease